MPHVDKLAARAKIIDLFKAQVGLRSLEVDHPVFHLIVYPDGSTNQPVPKQKTESNKPVTDTIFDLQANRAVINDGVLLLNQRALPFSVAGNNVSTLITYRREPEAYLGTVHIEDLTAERGKAPAVHSKLDLNVEMARNALKLDGLHFVSGQSKLEASGALNDFTKLNWQLGANGSVDLREVAALVPVEGLGGGEVGLQIKGQGTKAAAFDVTGNMQLKNATYRQSYLLLSGINATTSLHATQDEITLPNVKVRLRRGGGVDANARLVNYMAPAPPVEPAAAMPVVQDSADQCAEERTATGGRDSCADLRDSAGDGLRNHRCAEVRESGLRYAGGRQSRCVVEGFDQRSDGERERGSDTAAAADAKRNSGKRRDRCGLCAARRQAGRAAY